MHSHNHNHDHGKDSRIGWTFFLNVSFTIIEFIGGWLTNSTAIMADAVHDLGDSLSIGFTIFILFNVLKNLKTTLALFLQAVPDQKLQSNIFATLKTIPEIKGIHHMHFWSLDGESHVLTAHLELTQNFAIEDLIRLKKQVAIELSSYDLSHTTIEFEFPQETCRDQHEEQVHG